MPPKEVLALLRVDGRDHIHLTEAPDGSLRPTAYDPDFAEQMEHGRNGISLYRNALGALAK